MIKGEKAGTALRTMFTNLAKPTKAMQNKMEELGISITDSNGKMLPMRDVMDQLRGKFKGLSKDQQASAAATIFGKEAMSGALAVINASDEDYKKLTKSIDNSTGASKRMSDEMEGGIGGSIRKMKSAIESMAISIGDVLAPHIRKAADFLAMLADKFTSMPGWVKTGVVGLGIFAAALGPLILTTGAFTAALGSIMTTIGPVMTGITKAGGLMNFLGTKAPFAAKGLTLVGGAFKFMLGPVGLAIAAIAAIGTAFVIAYKKSETFRNIVNAVINPIKNAVISLWNGIKDFATGIKNVFSGDTASGFNIFKKILPKEAATQLTSTLLMIRGAFREFFTFIKNTATIFGAVMSAFWQQHGSTIINVFNTIKSGVGFILNALFNNIIKPVLTGIGNIFKIIFGGLKAIVINVFTAIRMIVQGNLTAISGIINVFKGLFTGNFRLMWEGIKQVFSGALTSILGVFRLTFGNILIFLKTNGLLILNALKTVWTIIKNIIVGLVTLLINSIKSRFTALKTILTVIFTGIANIACMIWAGIKSAVLIIVSALVNGMETIFNGLKTFFTNLWNGIKSVAISVWNAIKNAVLAIIRAYVNTAKAIFSTLKVAIVAIWNTIKRVSITVWTAIKNTVISIIRSLSNTVRAIFNAIKAFTSAVWRAIKTTVISLAKGLYNGVKNAFNALKSSITSIFNAVKSFLFRIWSAIKSKISSLVQSLRNYVTNRFTSLKEGVTNATNRAKSALINAWQTIKSKISGIAQSLKDKVMGTFNKMKDGMANIINKIKDHIGGMVGAVKSGLNKLIKGLNWVGGKLGMEKIPTLSTGTQKGRHRVKATSDGRLKQGTMAVVGDKGPGNGKGRDGRRELIQYPNGRTAITPAKDTLTHLPKGSRVINGAMRQSVEGPPFSTGTIPHFSIGSMFKGSTSWVSNKASKAYEGAKSMVGNGKKWLEDKVSDVMDFVDNPGKLLDLALQGFGVDFSGYNYLIGDITKAAWKKIKKAAISWIKNGLEAQAGDGSVFDGFKILQKYSAPPYPPNPNYPFNGGVHHGVDYDTKVGTPIRTPMAGRVRKWYDGYGGGNAITVSKGKTHLWFMHLQEQLKKTGEQVKAGALIGKSGNTGSMTNYRHLHFQVNQGGESNSNSIEPLGWLKKNGKGGGGGKKAPSKWRDTIVRAAKKMKVSPSNAQINGIIAQIQRESGGDAGITQDSRLKDGNAGPNLARGLLQYVPSTFDAYKVKGHGDITSGYDQLLAFFNNSNWANDIQYGRSGWGPRGSRRFATGGLINTEGWYNLAEGGYPEWVIPTDPSRRSDAMKLLALAAQDIQSGRSDNKRPNNLKTPSANNSSDNTELLLQMIENQQKQINQQQSQMDILMAIARKELKVNLDGRELSRNNDYQQAINAQVQLMGG
ncbi:phage tail tape measure protein [Staphylococcus simulans]|uniref:phage tail tape measure protein n=1 Tax=Staphylococcus simulans TaxID=1286 RepID=UPI000D1EAA5B|nr:phage tail tape measure protein [Staphylococcus simulans]PTI93398.1 phage tail tape measure protein [Staphylococcus simulans]PTJ38183.1 phage tail tape measure protein [Staphylococcus simulans]